MDLSLAPGVYAVRSNLSVFEWLVRDYGQAKWLGHCSLERLELLRGYFGLEPEVYAIRWTKGPIKQGLWVSSNYIFLWIGEDVSLHGWPGDICIDLSKYSVFKDRSFTKSGELCPTVGHLPTRAALLLQYPESADLFMPETSKESEEHQTLKALFHGLLRPQGLKAWQSLSTGTATSWFGIEEPVAQYFLAGNPKKERRKGYCPLLWLYWQSIKARYPETAVRYLTAYAAWIQSSSRPPYASRLRPGLKEFSWRGSVYLDFLPSGESDYLFRRTFL